MLAIEGLALGLLCGLIASLFRLVKPAFSIAISSVFFTIWTCGFGFYTLLTQSSHSDGIERSQQAFLKYGLFGLAIFVGAGSLISIFLRRLNRRTIGQNLTSLIIDISLLVIASTTLNSVILSNISNQEFSAIQA
ncbi:MAG: hypothetical protein WCG75_04970, partial [Armatimonadota bacterium]